MYKQMDLFDNQKKPLDQQKKIRLIELFGGIGSQAKALENIGANFEHYKVVEFDRNAINSYNAIHGTNFETSDIRDIHAKDLGIEHKELFTYLLTYSFPCQDLSQCGKKLGFSKGSGTRSSLLWEVERILDECEELPQILVMENVPQIINKKNMATFQIWLDHLTSLGYSNYYEILNARDFGIPQNRRRCFMVSLLDKRPFEFPKPFELKLSLKDMLEDDVDEKYYLDDEQVKNITWENGTSENAFPIKQATKLGYENAYEGDSVTISFPNSKTRRGRVGHQVCQTLTSIQETAVVVNNKKEIRLLGGIGEKNSNNGTQYYMQKRIYDNDLALSIATAFNPYYLDKQLRIRKITPRECWRLMGFTDEDFDKAAQVTSNNKLYVQGGNTIVVNVLMEVFKKLIERESE